MSRTVEQRIGASVSDEIMVDLFAGCGGASLGIEEAFRSAGIRRGVAVAVNHSPIAIACHGANHPGTRHFCEDVFDIDPVYATGGRPMGLLWASPDCKHHSKAKGGRPRDKNIRSLAWVVHRWASKVRPRVIILENVEEFADWGPLDRNNRPDRSRMGETFGFWVKHLRDGLGYRVDWRELRACDYGTPTTRKRLFLVARCDGLPIVWPAPTHADPVTARRQGLAPWRTAAECIDWSLPCPSIFLTTEEARRIGVRRPLAENTLRRIAHGVTRYVVKAADPFIVTYYGPKSGEFRGQAIGEPLRTQTTENRFGLVTAFLTKHYTGVVGDDLRRPVPTVTATDHNALTTAHLLKLRGTSRDGQELWTPTPTVTAGGNHIAEVRAFLVKYYGTGTGQSLREPMHTITTKDRLGLVTVAGQEYRIADIGMRMLTPGELARAQGFPPDYRLDVGPDGKPLSKRAQVNLIGNSVCWQVAAVLARANYVELMGRMDLEEESA